MPPFLDKNQKQLTTEEANKGRFTTASRWVVENANGIYNHYISSLKFDINQTNISLYWSKLKPYLLTGRTKRWAYFANAIPNQCINHLREDLRNIGAIINW